VSPNVKAETSFFRNQRRQIPGAVQKAQEDNRPLGHAVKYQVFPVSAQWPESCFWGVWKSCLWPNFGVRAEKFQRGFDCVAEPIGSHNIGFGDLQDDFAIIIQKAAAFKKFERHTVA